MQVETAVNGRKHGFHTHSLVPFRQLLRQSHSLLNPV
jgi:hypothetical protein